MIVRRFVIALLPAAVATMASCGTPVVCGDSSTSVKAADCVAWTFFAQMNRPAASNSPDAQWERWAEASQLFNPSGPVWPKPEQIDKKLEPLRQKLDLSAAAARVSPLGGNSEVRLNRATFDFVVNNGLWKADGLKKAAADLDFPTTALDVKAVWDPDPEGLGRQHHLYHWNYSRPQHQPIRLAAIHISSKAIPNWLWATWKHESALDTTDDTFGYVQGKPTAELSNLFRYYGVPEEWTHYRLVGTQTEFTDSKGNPRRLGNLRIEGTQNASCMTCHAMARYDQYGAIYTRDPMCCYALGCCDPFVGALLGSPIKASFKGMHQLDFVWSFSRIQNGLNTQSCDDTSKPAKR